MKNSLQSNATPLNPVTPQATGASWRDYPTGVDGHNAITTAGKSLSDRLSALSEILFTDDADEINLRIVDVRSDNGKDFHVVTN